ncbi:asparagine synthase C-terminal domain-containing protein [Candidatus Micrarchaeota archaeon]|nr:asparagine synthase C-terminal domain-containing protein [Candidatus Micrarchaeota archaeon]
MASAGLKELFVRAVSESVAGVENPFVLFSGGVDSSSIAQVAKQANSSCKFLLFGTEGCEDVRFARRVAREMEIELMELIVGEEEVFELFEKVKKILSPLSNCSFMQVELGVPLYACCLKAREEGSEIVVAGQGAEELFGGYARHFQAFLNGEDVKKMMGKDFANLRETDLNRNDLVARAARVELRCPFLNEQLVKKAQAIDVLKNFSREGGRKLVLRDVARELSVPELACSRAKRAMQYGSGVHALLLRKHKTNANKNLFSN